MYPNEASDQAADEPMEAVYDYRDIEEVLRRSADFVIGDTKAPSHEFLAGSITTMDGDEHVARRRLLSRTVNVRQPWGPEGTLFDEIFARNMTTLHDAAAASSSSFNLVDFARQTIWETICRMLGIDDVSSPERAAQLRSLAAAFVEAATVEFTLKDEQQVVDAGREAMARVRADFFLPSYRRRLAEVERAREDPTIALSGDLITTMILASDGKPDEELILRESMVFFTASVNNPVNQTPFALADLEQWLAEHPEDRALLDDDHFYSRCAQETLRLHRTGNPYLIRRVREDTELKSGRAFKQGDRLALYIGIANLEEGMWGADAKRFNPHRVVPDGLQPFGLGFGGGAHMCIGRPLLVFERGAPIKLGLQARMLKSLVLAGVRSDPAGERVKAPHAGDRYLRFDAMVGEPLAVEAQ